MSGSYRGAVFAAFGCVAFGAGAGIAALNYAQQQHEQAVAANQHGGRDQRRPQQADTDHAGVPGFVQGFLSNPEPTSTAEREQRDLAAQENTAVWAFWMTLFTGAQFLLSGFGLWALLETIKQGRAGLAKATEANELTEKHARIELRAYLTAASAAYFVEDDILRVGVAFRNSGATPAKGVQMILTTFMNGEQLQVELLPDIGRDGLVPVERNWQRCATDGSVQHWQLTGSISYYDVLTPANASPWVEHFVFTFDEEGEVGSDGWTPMKPMRADVGYRPA